MLKILAVDFGDARTGIAISDAMEYLASPLGVIEERNFDKCIEKVRDTAVQNGANEVIVGYPKNMNGTIGERAEKCQLFSEKLAEALENKIEIKLWDERCTTVSAHNYLNQTNTRGKKRKAIVDAVAATIILESYLEFRKNQNR